MSDYTKVYDGAAKDAAGSILAGVDFDVEFDALETAVNSKANLVVPATAGDIALLNASGHLADSGLTPSALATKTGTETLTNKTLTSPVINTGVINTSVSGTAILDEDDMASNSNTQLSTQQAIKAYVDAASPVVYTQNLAGLVNKEYAVPTGTKKIMISMWDVDSSANVGTGILIKRGGTWVTSSVYDGMLLFQNAAGNSSVGYVTGVNLFNGTTTGNIGGIATLMRDHAEGWVWNSLFNRFGSGNWSGAGHIEANTQEITDIRIFTNSGTWVSGGMQVRFEK